MDNGGTAAYIYDALDRRVQATVNGTTTKTAYNIYGQRTSIWDASGTLLNEQIYWGGMPVAFFANGPLGSASHRIEEIDLV